MSTSDSLHCILRENRIEQAVLRSSLVKFRDFKDKKTIGIALPHPGSSTSKSGNSLGIITLA
jgi:hypothetical protein